MSVETPSMTTAHIHAAIGWRNNKIREYQEDNRLLQAELDLRRTQFQSAVAALVNIQHRLGNLEEKLEKPVRRKKA